MMQTGHVAGTDPGSLRGDPAEPEAPPRKRERNGLGRLTLTSGGVATPPPAAASDAAPGRLRPEVAGLRLLAPSALITLLIAGILVASGPGERKETLAWVLAYGVAIPGGLLIGARQTRELAAAAPAATWRALAVGVGLLAAALVVRSLGTGSRPYHLIVFAAAAGALAAPTLAARRWRDPRDVNAGPAPVVALVALGAVVLPFVPDDIVRADTLVAAVVLAAATLLALSRIGARQLPHGPRRALDVTMAVLLVAFVATLPELGPPAKLPELAPPATLQHHYNFFLGPVNAVLHDRLMLDGAWSQYGVGSIDALALVFTVLPIGYGQLLLIVVAAMCLQFVCVLATLRLAGVGQLLAGAALAVAVLCNILALSGPYVVYPSITPLRFGIPYLIVLAAVLGARRPQLARPLLWVQLGLIALAAAWSFETWVYSASTYGFLVIADALRDRQRAVRVILVRAAHAVGASVAGIAAVTLGTLLIGGSVEWGPYVSFLRVYSSRGFGLQPIDFFSPGPLVAAEIFLTAAALLWLALDRPRAIAAPAAAALAGYTGFAIGAFTYYIGRSESYTLMNLLVPPLAIGALWIHVLMAGPRTRWRTGAAAALLVGAGAIAAGSWPQATETWRSSAFAKAVPFIPDNGTGQGESLGGALDRLWHNPVLDPRAPVGVALLDRHLPGQDSALVVTEPDLTTEILLRARRDNLVPLTNAVQDDLVPTLVDRARVAAEEVPAGTLLLTSPVPRPAGQWNSLAGTTRDDMEGTRSTRDFTRAQSTVLEVLHRRFRFSVVDGGPGGLQVVRLEPHGSAG